MKILQSPDLDDDYLSQFGIKLSREMSLISARILKTPQLSYHPSSRESSIIPTSGTWNLKDKLVAQGVTINSWTVVVFSRDEQSHPPLQSVQKFIKILSDTMNECGVFVSTASQPPITFSTATTDEIQHVLMNSYRLVNKSRLILCVLPSTHVGLYSEIKRVGDTIIGVPTQCVQMKHMHAARRQYCANISLKVSYILKLDKR